MCSPVHFVPGFLFILQSDLVFRMTEGLVWKQPSRDSGFFISDGLWYI